MPIVRDVIGVRRGVWNVLWANKVLLRRVVLLLGNVILLWGVTLLWDVILLWDVVLLWNVIRNVWLVQRVVLVVRLVSRVGHCVDMRCCMRDSMQVIAMRHQVSVRRCVRHVINVRVRVIVLCESRLRRNESNSQSKQTQFCF